MVVSIGQASTSQLDLGQSASGTVITHPDKALKKQSCYSEWVVGLGSYGITAAKLRRSKLVRQKWFQIFFTFRAL